MSAGWKTLDTKNQRLQYKPIGRPRPVRLLDH